MSILVNNMIRMMNFLFYCFRNKK